MYFKCCISVVVLYMKKAPEQSGAFFFGRILQMLECAIKDEKNIPNIGITGV